MAVDLSLVIKDLSSGDRPGLGLRFKANCTVLDSLNVAAEAGITFQEIRGINLHALLIRVGLHDKRIALKRCH